MVKVGFFHTGAGLSGEFDSLAQQYIPNTDRFHVVDESVIDDLLEVGDLTPEIKRRITSQLALAERGGADILLDTCSSTSPAVDVAREVVGVPILKIDDPLAERAVELGENIHVVATAVSTLGPSTELIGQKAEERGENVTIESSLVDDAFAARTEGNLERHDELVSERVIELSEEADVIVLAQASMSHLDSKLEDKTSVPVLSSPELAMSRLASIVDDMNQ